MVDAGFIGIRTRGMGRTSLVEIDNVLCSTVKVNEIASKRSEPPQASQPLLCSVLFVHLHHLGLAVVSAHVFSACEAVLP